MIQISIDLWTRSPKAYLNLKQTLRLPSIMQLQRYKNFVNQQPGIQLQNLQWMHLEAERRKLSVNGREGYLVFDEVSIQVCG